MGKGRNVLKVVPLRFQRSLARRWKVTTTLHDEKCHYWNENGRPVLSVFFSFFFLAKLWQTTWPLKTHSLPWHFYYLQSGKCEHFVWKRVDVLYTMEPWGYLRSSKRTTVTSQQWPNWIREHLRKRTFIDYVASKENTVDKDKNTWIQGKSNTSHVPKKSTVKFRILYPCRG